MGKKVFISHASADSELINILIKFLNNIGIINDDIFCTSVDGTLEGGKSFVQQIQDNVKGSKAVIFLLSERFFHSYFCLAELGAAWALNQNILPVIVPPISTAEYNKTPLIGIQALNIGSANFASQFFNNLVQKSVLESSDLTDKNPLFNDFTTKIKKEMSILHRDSDGFYIARLSDEYIMQTETTWKLNGILDIETDSSITENWILMHRMKLASSKIQFKVGEPLKQQGNQKLYSIKCFYILP